MSLEFFFVSEMSFWKMPALITFSLISIYSLLVPSTHAAITESSRFYRAEVKEIIEKGINDFGSFEHLKAQITKGDEEGKVIEIEAGDIFLNSASHGFEEGDMIVVRKDEYGEFQFVERYRLPKIYLLLAFFCGLAILVGGKKGVYGLIGLITTIGIIGFFLIPQVEEGMSIYTAGFISLFFIGTISVVVAHGFHKTTLIALSAIGITLSSVAGFTWVTTLLLEVFGLGTETPLQVFAFGLTDIDFRGLFLIGTLLGALGVLDDVTTAQATVVSELKKANPLFTSTQLYRSAEKVGKEHIVSMINTLFLAYAGISLPLLLLFYADPMPLWAFINSEMMAEEIIRTVIGSSAILLSVPLTTAIAAYIFGRKFR